MGGINTPLGTTAGRASGGVFGFLAIGEGGRGKGALGFALSTGFSPSPFSPPPSPAFPPALPPNPPPRGPPTRSPQLPVIGRRNRVRPRNSPTTSAPIPISSRRAFVFT